MNQSLKCMLILVAVLSSWFFDGSTIATTAEDANPEANSDDHVYYYGAFNRFKPGKESEAREFIYDHFWTVDKVIERKPIAFDFVTGPWHHIVFFRLENGLADAEFTNTAQVPKWLKQFEKQEGGSEAAAKSQAHFDAMIDETVSGVFKIPSDDVEAIENAYSYNSKKNFFRVVFANYKASKEPAATKMIMEQLRTARLKTGRLVVPLFSVAGPYDHIVFVHLDPSSLDNIIADSQDADWVKAMGGAEKTAKAQSIYSDYLQQVVREIAVGSWYDGRAAKQ
ncbi:MAG: hypothetical protein P8N76_25620 [Pirellulaceae bacterium]|nr:hypothetical protein [Pirellulaceae bacterium]